MPRWLTAFALCLFTAGPAVAAAPARSPEELAVRIDARLDESFRAKRITPAPPALDAEFLRRVYLDVVGRIPTIAEARAFLDDPAADKRERLVETLLAGPGYAAHAARVWRAFLVPQATANLPTQYLGVGVEAWLREQFRAGHTDDRVVRDLLTARLDYLDWSPDKRPRPAAGLSPVGFYQALGIDVKKQNLSNICRPIRIVDKAGQPIKEVLA
jgi:Protein of unknown function (DUF1549)